MCLLFFNDLAYEGCKLMKKIKDLMGATICGATKISKKTYVSGLVIVTGLAVTVLMMGVNGYSGNQSVELTKNLDHQQDESEDEDIPLLTITTVDISDEIHGRYIEPYLNTLIQVESEDFELLTASRNQLVEAETLYTEKEYTALLTIVEAEATSEDMIGRIMVANVVLNRVKSKRFPDTIYDVVHQEENGKYQFSPLYDGRYYTVTISDKTKEAVERAIAGEDYSNGALFFVARSLASDGAVSWFDKNLQKVAEHGVHEFYDYY